MWRYIDLRLFKSLILILVFAGCKKNDANDPAASPGSLTYNEIAQSLTIMERASLKVEQYFQNQPDTVGVLFDVSQWILNQNGISEVYMIDDYMLEVHHANGLVTDLVLQFVDPNGKAYIRGAGTGGGLKAFGGEEIALNHIQEKIIENKKVLVFIPFNNQFYGGNYPFLNKIKNAPLGLDVTLVSEKSANLAVLNTFKDYGLIIINTHGKPDGFEVKTQAPLFSESRFIDTGKVVESMLVEQQMRAAGITPRQLEDGDIKLNAYLELQYGSDDKPTGYQYRYGIQVTDKHIRKLPALEDAVIFGNYCYSGYTRDGANISNIPEAFKSIGAITYYGYARDDHTSDQVNTTVAEQVESSLLDRLLYDKDSTGYAHLKADGSEWDDPSSRRRIKGGQKTKVTRGTAKLGFKSVHKRKLGPPVKLKHFHDRYYYYDCGNSMIDSRDQEVYKTVKIGNQEWMAENLRWAGSGICYNNQASNCEDQGRLYSVYEATGKQTSNGGTNVRGVCPQGWHIPSKAEWEELINYCGGTDSALKKLLTPGYWPRATTNFENQFCFDLRSAPSAYLEAGQGPYFDSISFLIDQASYWSSTGTLGLTDPVYGYIVDDYHVIQVAEDPVGSNSGNYKLSIEKYSNAQQFGSYRYRHCRCIKD